MNTSISNTKFTKNYAHIGAGLTIEGLTDTQLVDSELTGNLAFYYNDTIGTGNGGGIYYNC